MNYGVMPMRGFYKSLRLRVTYRIYTQPYVMEIANVRRLTNFLRYVHAYSG